jgi:hypothetical protein
MDTQFIDAFRRRRLLKLVRGEMQNDSWNSQANSTFKVVGPSFPNTPLRTGTKVALLLSRRQPVLDHDACMHACMYATHACGRELPLYSILWHYRNSPLLQKNLHTTSCLFFDTNNDPMISRKLHINNTPKSSKTHIGNKLLLLKTINGQ